MSTPPDARVSLSTIVRQWGRIGLIGFGGPPAHIVLFRKLCVDERAWLTAHEFEDGIAATSLLPGPASTQLAIYSAWRLRGRVGAIIGGLSFILPGLTIILALSALFLSAHPPLWVLGIAAGAGAAVPVVAVHAAKAFSRQAGDGQERNGPQRFDGRCTSSPEAFRRPRLDHCSYWSWSSAVPGDSRADSGGRWGNGEGSRA